MVDEKVEVTKEEVLRAIAIASGAHDWEEVDRLYKILFVINDGEEEVLEKKKFA
tara:strand:- start:263 stop:424 length:162 start_codon:yes stop_codon:yes gene_type:complete